MSDADPEAVTVSADGITVRKTVDTEQFQTLAVVVELASERDDLARVQLVDHVPPAVPMEDVGFHPEYGSEHWSVEGEAVAFERDFEPGETYTTIYGIRDYPTAEVDALLGEPQLGLVDTGPGSLDEVVDVVRQDFERHHRVLDLFLVEGGDALQHSVEPPRLLADLDHLDHQHGEILRLLHGLGEGLAFLHRPDRDLDVVGDPPVADHPFADIEGIHDGHPRRQQGSQRL
jgi:hypothetical protein